MKRFFVSFALMLISSIAMMAETVETIITVNGTEVNKAMTEITFSGNDVVINYDDGTSATFTKSDEIILTFDKATAVQTTKSAIEAFTYGGIVDNKLVVSGIADGTDIVVYSVNGVNVAAGKVVNGTARIDVSGLTAGVYVMRAGNKVIKFMKN